MASLNRVFLIGNLTKDPELKYTPSGMAVTTFTIAVNHTYKTQTGERKEEADFIRVDVFGKLAENCAKFLSKGRSVFVEGRLRFHAWESQDGQKKTRLDVLGNIVQFLGNKSESVEKHDQTKDFDSTEPDMSIPQNNDDIPF